MLKGGVIFSPLENCDPYVFVGWRIKDSADGKIYSAGEDLEDCNGDITFVAVFQEVTVTYEYEYGTLPADRQDSETIEYGDPAILPDLEDCGERKLLGWRVKNSDDIDIYPVDEEYYPCENMTFVAVYDEFVTMSVPFTTTVKQRGNVAPGKTTFELEIVGANTNEENYEDVTVSAAVTTNGVGSYAGTMTLTGPYGQLRDMLCQGAFVKQVNAGEANWIYDDAVFGLLLPPIAARSTAVEDTVFIYPAACKDTNDGIYYVMDGQAEPLERMSFTNTYTKSVTEEEEEEPEEPERKEPNRPTQPLKVIKLTGTETEKPAETNPNTGAC